MGLSTSNTYHYVGLSTSNMYHCARTFKSSLPVFFLLVSCKTQFPLCYILSCLSSFKLPLLPRQPPLFHLSFLDSCPSRPLLASVLHPHLWVLDLLMSVKAVAGVFSLPPSTPNLACFPAHLILFYSCSCKWQYFIHFCGRVGFHSVCQDIVFSISLISQSLRTVLCFPIWDSIVIPIASAPPH